MHFPLYVAAISIMFAVFPLLHSYNFHYFCYSPYFWSLHFPLSYSLFLIHTLPISCRCFSHYLSLKSCEPKFYLCISHFSSLQIPLSNSVFPFICCCQPKLHQAMHFPSFVAAIPIMFAVFPLLHSYISHFCRCIPYF